MTQQSDDIKRTRIEGRLAHKDLAAKRGCYCTACPLAIGTPPVPGPYGTISTATNNSSERPYDAIVVVGEIPTFNDKNGPLSGRAKRNWKEALDKSGLSSLNLLLIPSTHCVPSDVMKKSAREKIVKACSPSASFTVAQYDKLPMLLMGSDAILTLGLEKKLTENRGFIHSGAGGRPFIITYAATTVMFGNIYMWGTFIEDLRRFYRLITKTLKPNLNSSLVKIHAKAPDIADFMRRAGNAPIGVDIETTAPAETPEWGLDATRASLKTIALGLPDYALSLSWSHSDYASRGAVRDILASTTIKKVYHNGPWFDLRVQERYGLDTHNWEDTRDLRRAISSTSRLSLGYLGSLYCDIHAWKLDDSNEKLSTSDNLDELLLYNGYDTIVTARVYAAMKAAINE